jgi:hypothetical protein
LTTKNEIYQINSKKANYGEQQKQMSEENEKSNGGKIQNNFKNLNFKKGEESRK